MLFIKNLLADLVSLKKPVTATAVVALVIELISPFGIDVGTLGPVITGALVAVGTIAAYVEHLATQQ